MVRLVLEISLPFIIVLIVAIARLYVDIKRPVPRALGTIIPKLCVVHADEIRRFNAALDEEIARLGQNHLAQEVRWKQKCVNWAYLRQMLWNTRSFQQTLRFEILKIDPRKSSLEYEPHERLASELVDEATAIRQELVGWQITFVWRAAFRLTMNHQALMTLLATYKQLEQEMVTLAGMAENDVFREMLIERLGLTSWGLIDGGAALEADPA